MQVNNKKLEYTFEFQKVGHQITIVLKDDGKYNIPKVKNFLVDNKEYKVASKLEDPFVKAEQRRAYAIKLTKEIKSLFDTKADFLRLNEESEDFVRNYSSFRKEFLFNRDKSTFDENKEIKATLINYNDCSLSIDYENAYAQTLVKNINKNIDVLNFMLKDLSPFKTYINTDAHHSSIGYKFTGKDLVNLSQKATKLLKKIEQEEAYKLTSLKEKAAKEGPQLMEQWAENKKCEVIICKKYMMPDGNIKVERERTW